MSPRKRPKGKIVLMALAIAILCGVLAFLLFAYRPIGSDDLGTVVVDIPRGSGFIKTVSLLDQAGLVANKPLFYALALVKGAARQIRAGEYEFTGKMSPLEMLDKLVRGNIKYYLITIPEDFTIREIAARLAASNLVDERKFIALTADKNFLAELNIKAETAEGYLYPETYRFDRSMSDRDIMRTMVRQFWKSVTPDLRKRASVMRMPLSQVVTLASMIGKETGYKEEKPLVAAVFHNRLRKGMKLQSDPTAVYNLENFDGIVKRHHLLRDHHYNTYKIAGLPPGPIGNPDVYSIRAVLYPADVDYLYFVSNNNGSHTFSSSLTAHNRAVSKYQIQKKNP